MDSTIAWVIGGALVALVVMALIMGRRFGKGMFKIGKHVSGSVESRPAGAAVRDVDARGRDHVVTAEGSDALVERAKVEGSNIQIGAKTTPSDKKPR
jgi:hypothetical protein